MFGRTLNGHARKRGAQWTNLKMLLVAIAIVGFGSLACTNQIYAASVNSGTVKVKSGNVRQGASTSDAVAFGVKANDVVAILGEENGSDGNKWYKITIGGYVGYIRSDLVTKSDNKIIVSDSLVSKAAQGSLTTGNQPVAVSVSNRNETGNTLNTSMAESQAIQFNDFSIDMSSIPAGIINGTSVRLRSGATITSPIITHLDKGDIVFICAEGKTSNGEVWYQVKANDYFGFVRSDLINKISKNQDTVKPEDAAGQVTEEGKKPADTLGETQNNDAQETEKTDNNTASANAGNIIAGAGRIKGTGVRVRDKASITGVILKTGTTGDVFPVLGKEAGDGREWIKVKVLVEQEYKDGYIAADYFEVTLEPSVKDSQDTQEAEKKEEKTEEQKEDTNAIDTSVLQDKSASIKGVGVRIRTAPVTGNVICQLSSGHPVEVVESVNGEDEHTWYQVTFSYQGNVKNGYVRDDFVQTAIQTVTNAPIGDEEFENSIASFPEAYKNSLRALHAAHPMWKFTAVDTGLDWNDALKAESAVGKNLVSKNCISSWKSTAAQAYNWSNNTWYTFDGGSWVSASPELIAYYMDPRNFLNESGIYQFEQFGYNESQQRENVAKMLSGTFMSGQFTDTDGTTAEYADVFVQVGQMTGVSPYLLAGRCIQEQGVLGKSQSVSGTVPGYEGYFNYFNVGAYAYSGRGATINGLIYAKGNDSDSGRPWNTRIRSIYGGARYIADKFISKGQDTLYFQKFNVVNSENTLYSHQYMSNIQAASSESARIQLAYLGDDEAITFKIPVYRNMPATNCVKPTSDSSPNTYLASITVDGYELIPAFSGATENYVVKVDPSAQFVTINATAVGKSSSIGGIGTYPINAGNNAFRIACKSQNGSVKIYTVNVQK